MHRSLTRNITLFYVYRFLRDAQVWIPVWVVFLTLEKGFTLAQVTFADGLYFLATMLLEVPTGAVADRWGRSKSVGLGCIVLAVAVSAFAFATSFPLLMLSFMLWSLASALMSGADLALLYDSLLALGREDEYERHAGRGEAFVWLGAALATLIGGPLAAATSIEFTIFVGAGCLLVAATVAFLMTEAPHRADPAITTRYLSTLRAGIRAAWRDPALRALVVLGGIVQAAIGGAMYLVQPLLLDRGVEVGGLFSLLQVPQLVIGAAGALMVASLLRRFGDVTVFVGIAACGVAAYAGLATIPTLAAFALIPVIAMLESMIIPLTTGYVNRRAPSEQRATILSLESLSRGFFVAPLAPVVGAVADARGVEWAFGTLGIALAVGALVAMPVWIRAHRRSLALDGGRIGLAAGSE